MAIDQGRTIPDAGWRVISDDPHLRGDQADPRHALMLGHDGPSWPIDAVSPVAGCMRAQLDLAEVIRASFDVPVHEGAVPTVEGYPGRTGRGMERVA